VREYERRGIAAVCIEDKLFPKRNSFYAGNQDLLPTDEFVAKLKAAKAAQADPDFIVIARTEAMVSGFGPDEVIRRAEAYAQAGADMILVHSKAKVLDEVRAVMALGCKFKPVAIIPTTYDVSATELAQLEVSMVIFANQGLRSAVRSMRETFRTLARTNQPSCVEENLATLKEIFALQRMENWEL
jgi:phosphoenolpyruvate phosphomutase